MYSRQVRLARGISKFLASSEDYELLPLGANGGTGNENFEDVHIIVIFRARDDATNVDLVKSINSTRKMYVSGTKWDGKPACRIAVSTWRVEVERDLKLVSEVLENIVSTKA